jgi:mono/diheme cytochrome c family protein
MLFHRAVFMVAAGILSMAAVAVAAETNHPVATAPVYVPDTSHAGDPLPDNMLAWDSTSKETNAAADQPQAHFVFNFTNVSTGNVTFIAPPRPSCGCTTAEVPPIPWTIPSGAHEQIGVTVNLAFKTGILYKTVNVITDKGSKLLTLRINIQPPVIRTLSDAERARGMLAAKADRQAVFKNDCATCHVKPGIGKYGKSLYDAVCAICHEGEHRATMVPDLHHLKTPTNDQFWRVWIAHGKPGSLMPAFSTADGGPLNDLQIASLAAYLDAAMPSPVPVPPQ